MDDGTLAWELPGSDLSSSTNSTVALSKSFQLPSAYGPLVCTKEEILCLKKCSNYQNTFFMFKMLFLISKTKQKKDGGRS